MFSQSKDKIQTLRITGNEDPFYNVINDNEFPIRRYIEKKYGCSMGFFYADDEYTGDIFKFLIDNGKLLSYTSVGKLSLVVKDVYKGLRGGTFWFYYKNTIIIIYYIK